MIFSELENIRKEKRDNQKVVSLLFDSLNRLEMCFSPSSVSNVLMDNFYLDVFGASGVKVQKKVTDNGAITTIDYLDGFQYTQNILEFFPHAEGYVKATEVNESPTASEYAFNYVFNYTDHLGNVRLSFTKDPLTQQLKIMEENHYYPFGLKHSVYAEGNRKDFKENLDGGSETILTNVLTTSYQYKYNGKEFQDELGLNMYDMDMRQYDPAIARWVVLDPVIHHSMSPYNAFDNNPVFWADPSGADSEKTTQELIDGIRNATPENGSFFWQNTKKNKKNEDENEDGDENDDIRFRDKNGNVIATFETKEIDDDVYLPVEVTDGEPNININVLMRLAGIDIEDIDIVGIGGSWDFAFGMGGSKGIEYVYFLDGKNAGCWQAFIVEKGNVGLMGSAGVYGIIGDYYNDNSLTIGDYAGTSFSFNVGVKGPWIGSYGKFWAPKPEIKDNLGIKSGFNTNLRSWTGYTVGGGLGAGAQWSKQNTRIYNP